MLWVGLIKKGVKNSFIDFDSIVYFEFEGIEIIYQVLVSPKQKYPAFKSYLIYLNHKNCINIDDGKIKKSSKTISLKTDVFLEFDAIIKFHEKNILSNNK